MTRLLTDSFTESANTLLSAHTPDLGGAWTIYSSATMTVLAAEGRVRGSDTASGAVYYNSATSAANVAVAATVRRTTSTGGDCNPGVIARLQDGADNRYIASHNGSTLSLQKRVAGVTTTLGAWTTSFPANTDCTLELRVNGSDLTALWNGTAFAASDAAVSGAGYAAIACRLNGRLDNLTADTIAWPLTPAKGTHATSADATALGISYALAPAKAVQAASSDASAVAVGYALAPARASQATGADAAGLGVTYALAPVDGTHAGSADASALAVAYSLAPRDGAHAPSSDMAALGIAYALAPLRAAQPMSSDPPTVAWLAPLRPERAAHATIVGDAVVRRALPPPAPGIALRVAADRRLDAIEHDQRTEEIHRGKAVHSDVLDGALTVIKTAATKMVALASQPADYSAASSGKLVEATLATGDFTLAAGDVSGRKVTVAAKSGLSVAAAGTATHVALLDPATTRLLYVTTCPAQALSAGGTVNIAAWDVEIGSPS